MFVGTLDVNIGLLHMNFDITCLQPALLTNTVPFSFGDLLEMQRSGCRDVSRRFQKAPTLFLILEKKLVFLEDLGLLEKTVERPEKTKPHTVKLMPASTSTRLNTI